MNRRVKIRRGRAGPVESTLKFYWHLEDEHGAWLCSGRIAGAATPALCIEQVGNLFPNTDEAFDWTVTEKDRRTDEIKKTVWQSTPYEAQACYQNVR